MLHSPATNAPEPIDEGNTRRPRARFGEGGTDNASRWEDPNRAASDGRTYRRLQARKGNLKYSCEAASAVTPRLEAIAEEIERDRQTMGGPHHARISQASGLRPRFESVPQNEEHEERVKRVSEHVKAILEELGDHDRRGLRGTSKRCAKALLALTKGYETSIESVVAGAVSEKNRSDGMIILKDVEVISLCQHHLIPFTCKVQIGYVPARHVIELGKLVDIVEVLAYRLQTQANLTEQVTEAIAEVLEPHGVGVIVKSKHLCSFRHGPGKAEKQVTSCMLGCFKSRGKNEEFRSRVGA
ncbi:hypothetical protein N7532_003348 [Penicillium argentinense]|uniref:GTP cyclohydrolase 1 n=1 Tax=Penicillium argentinense TaxID=1131581 RepID=A0A9W9FM78_9EURO|nr:uncharacterized protein N7532_003348 [Penicillium argentinense]KAJ5102819.1 hypothetical protein N7532_003348 [Penicillium argentinense]